MADQSIGAARVHLIVDATDWDATLKQARNSAEQFGDDAARAFDKSSGGTRRAAERLLDYVATLGRADTQMERYVRNAQRAGVDEPLIRAAIQRWEQYQRQIDSTANALREAQQIDRAFNAQRAAVSQREIGGLLGVGESDAAAQARRRADAEAALIPLLQQQERAYAAIYNEAQQINRARDEALRSQAQMEFNQLLGVADGDGEQRIRRQADARAALTGIIEQEIQAEQRLEAQRLKGQQFLQYLENLRDTAGKTHWEVLRLKAAQAGVSEEALPMIQGLEDQAAAMGHAGLTAKQYEWAMRGLPAQFTDISVGLATGQKWWMVLLQQGGQIKDMFGGLRPAIQAVGQALMRMVNPLTITVAVAAAAGYAWWKLGEDARNARRNIEDMANQVDDITRLGYFARSEIEVRNYAEALADLGNVRLGRLTDVMSGMDFHDQSLAAGELYLAITRISGKNEEIREQWQEITNAMLANVSTAAEQLFSVAAITEEQRNTIQALEQIGNLEEARAMVLSGILEVAKQEEFYSQLKYPALRNEREVTARIEENRRRILRLQRQGSEASMVTAMNLGFENRELEDQLALLRSRNSLLAGAVDQSEENKQRARMERLQADLNSVVARYGTLQEQRAVALAESRAEHEKALLGATTEAERAMMENTHRMRMEGINKEYDEREKRDAQRGQRRGRGSDGTQAIRDAMQAELAAVSTQTRLLQSQYDQRELSVEAYYDKLRVYAGQELEITLRAIELQKQAVAGREDAAERIERLESQAARAREQHMQQAIELADGERQAVLQREVAYRQFTRSLADANEELERSMQSQVAAITMGSRRHEQLERENDILRQQNDVIRDVRRQVEDRTISTEEGERRIQAAMANTVAQMEIMRRGYDELREAQSSFTNGAARAIEDFMDDAADVATQGYQMVQATIDGFADATARALSGASGSFEQFFENLHIMILQFIVRQQLSKFLGSFMGGGTDSQGNTMGSVFDLFSGSWGFAQGGTPGGGVAAYRNQIVSQPTIFPFAKGGVPNIGIMGERSGKPHEAIMPLTRLPGGDLGVRVVESGQRGPTTVNQTWVVEGTPDRTTREQMARKTGRETSRALARG